MTAGNRLLLGFLRLVAMRRAALLVVSAIIILIAAILVPSMPLQLLPQISYPQIRIISDLPGQTSGVVEETINEPIEAMLMGMQGMVRLESRSGDARSYIDVFFMPGYDMDRALQDVNQAVQRAQSQIPDSFPPPRIFEANTTQEPALQIAFGSSEFSTTEIRQRLRAYVIPRLTAVTGVETVYMGRGEVPELVVDVDPFRTASLGVSLDALERLLLEATNPPLSSAMRSTSFEGVGVIGEDGWNPVRLGQRMLLQNGVNFPLSDLAKIHLSNSEERVSSRLNGVPAVLVSVHRSPQAQSLQMAEDVRQIVEQIAHLPAFASIEASILFDDAVVTRSAVQSVVTAAVGGSLLAMYLMFVVLRNRRYVPLVALVVAVSLAGAIIFLYATGMSLNLLTLAGLLLSVGLGLDYAIVYFDRLDRLRHLQSEAHLHAMVDVFGPLLGALLTTLAAVLPFMFVEGLIAMLFRPLIWTVMACAIFSFIAAVLLLPTFARQIASDTSPQRDSSESRMMNRWLRLARRPFPVWLIVILLAAGMYWGGKSLPFEVLPVVDDGFVDVVLTHPVGIPVAEMDVIAHRVEDSLMSVTGTASYLTTVGGYFREGLPSFRPGTVELMVRVDTGATDSLTWTRQARAAINALNITGLRVSITPPRIRGVQTRLAEADLIVVMARADGDILAMTPVETEVITRLREVEGLTGIGRMRSGVSPRWVADPDYQMLAAYGLDEASIKQTIEYALEGRILRQRVQGGEPLVLRMRYDRTYAGGPQQLARLPLLATDGRSLHLGSAVSFHLEEEPTHIERREGQRVVRVSANIDPDGPGAAVAAARVEDMLQQMNWDAGVSWWLEGDIDAIEETARTFIIALSLALLMVLALLIMQYGVVSYAATGLIIIPLSAAGTVGLLFVMDRALDAMVLAGIVIAVGIVANNVILVLSQTRNAIDTDGLSLREAVERAASDRFRPILLTVMSTVLGISPLLFGGAEVFGLLQPLAIALTGTLLLSIPLACLLLPGLLVTFARK